MESVNKAKNNSSCDGAVFRKVGGAILHHLKPHRICQLFASLPTKSPILPHSAAIVKARKLLIK
tara:strand:+ start:972 stop:1163 length:192 start_codon:yes stop_codon:yes gene_type:complete